MESPTRTRRPRRKGSAGGLTIFIFAVAGALLIPIGTAGQIRSGDPFGHDRAFYIRKSSDS